MAKAKVRKLDPKAFPAKVVILREVSLNRKQLKSMYEQFVDNLNDSIPFNDDDVRMTTEEVLECVPEAKFATVVEKLMSATFKDVSALDLMEAFVRYEVMEDDLPSEFMKDIKKSPVYQARILDRVERQRELDISRVINQAKALGLKVTR